jgi:HK97 family phage portal protein
MRFSFEFTRNREKRSADFPESNINNFVKWLASGVWGKKTSSGEAVDEESALKFSAVWACVRILSETIASLPLHVYKVSANGDKNINVSHPIYRLLHDEPNPLMTSFVYRETLMAHLCLWGNHYSEIIRNGTYDIKQLNIIKPQDVEVQINNKNELKYKVKETGKKERFIDADDILHIPGLSFNGLMGKSPIDVAAENIGLGLGLQRFGAEFFANGASLSATVKHPGKLSKTAYDNLVKSLNEKHTGEGNRHKIQILEEGMEWVNQVMPLEAAQFILSRRFQLNEIARIFRVPPHMLADLERSTNNNIEHQGIEFVQHTILPWCVRIEQEFNRKLFTEVEKRRGDAYVKFNLMGLLRGDAASRAQYYTPLFNIGVFSQNEIRALEDMNSIGPEGDKHFVQVNVTPVDQVGQNNPKQ